MKKYIVAAMVAVMAFAFAAFAASLDLDGGVLQAGSDQDLTCAESADVTYGFELFQGAAWVDMFQVTFDEDADCEGLSYALEVLHEDGTVIGVQHGEITSSVLEIPTSADVPIADIGGVTLIVHSDPTANNPTGWTSPPYGGDIPF